MAYKGIIVLNLIINGIPSILNSELKEYIDFCSVLNLIINGIPSIPEYNDTGINRTLGFKPYYKWNTFNTVLKSLIGNTLDLF